MTSDTKPPREKLSLNFGKGEKLPTQLQEKLQVIKDMYEKANSKTLPSSPPKNSEKLSHQTKPLTLEEEKKKKALAHEKEQRALQRQALRERQEALDWLYITYPDCFNREEPKPLKRHIEKDILLNFPIEASFSRVHIRQALAYYTSGIKYLEVLSSASHRYNLAGQEVEEVLSEHQQRASEQSIKLKDYLEKRKVERKTKKKAATEKEPSTSF